MVDHPNPEENHGGGKIERKYIFDSENVFKKENSSTSASDKKKETRRKRQVDYNDIDIDKI